MKLVSASQMQEIDNTSIHKFNIPSLTLMENAGTKVAEIVKSLINKNDAVLIVVGKGNNGGDGLVVARLLIEAKVRITVALLGPPEKLSKDAAANWKKLNRSSLRAEYGNPVKLKSLRAERGNPEKKLDCRAPKGARNDGELNPNIIIIESDAGLKDFDEALKKSKYVVDAIFGTGLNSKVSGIYLKVINKINDSLKYVFSIDIPSGLSADTGKPIDTAIRSRHTITFGLPKIGLVLPPALEFVKELTVVDIGFPEKLIKNLKTDINLSNPDIFIDQFKSRARDTNKSDFGHVLTLAGSMGKMGAGWLTSKAALRAGAGLVTYALPAAAFSKFDAGFAEIMIEEVADKKTGRFIPESLDDIKKLCKDKSVVAFGPGIGTKTDTIKAAQTITTKLNLPLVIDADGLNCLSGHLKLLAKRLAPTILTPHPGEMAKLTGLSKKAILADRIGIARKFAFEHKVFLVLKGHRSIIATPKGDIYINPTGNSGMSTAGAGDALTGIIAGFISCRMPPLEATVAAVYIHGLAGDFAAAKKSEQGMITSDLIENIPEAIKLITANPACLPRRE